MVLLQDLLEDQPRLFADFKTLTGFEEPVGTSSPCLASCLPTWCILTLALILTHSLSQRRLNANHRRHRFGPRSTSTPASAVAPPTASFLLPYVLAANSHSTPAPARFIRPWSAELFSVFSSESQRALAALHSASRCLMTFGYLYQPVPRMVWMRSRSLSRALALFCARV